MLKEQTMRNPLIYRAYTVFFASFCDALPHEFDCSVFAKREEGYDYYDYDAVTRKFDVCNIKIPEYEFAEVMN